LRNGPGTVPAQDGGQQDRHADDEVTPDAEALDLGGLGAAGRVGGERGRAGALSIANGNFQHQPLADTVGLLLAFAAFTGVGALVVAHRPGNAIGWIFSAIGLLAVTGAVAEEYAGYAVRTHPGHLPGGVVAGWYSGWAWFPTVALW
jgi:hypothetical protein